MRDPKSGDLIAGHLDVPPTGASAKTNTQSASGSDSPTLPPALTPEEQMALFEQELKEADWGHQPC